MRLRSINVTLALTAAAINAQTNPPDPAPITTRLVSNRLGFSNRRKTVRALAASNAFLASSGNSPSRANETINPGETMPATDVICPNCAPAFT